MNIHINLVLVLLIFSLFFLYYLVSEHILNGIGAKHLTNSRVVTVRTGMKPSFWRIILRTFFRLILFFFADLTFLFSSKPITLYDYLSGTRVVDIDLPEEEEQEG